MGKQQGKRQSEHSEDLDSAIKPWWENISYEGFIKLANSSFKPKLFLSLSGNEFKLLVYLTFLRWRFAEDHGRLRLGLDYLVNGTGLSEGTIRRCLKSLAKKQFIRLLKIDRNFGNNYLVYTVLLSISPDQNDRARRANRKSPDQNDRAVRSNLRDARHRSGTASDQIDQQDQIQTYQSDGAPRYQPPKTNEGGVAGSEGRSPNGHDQGNGSKGVALTGDDVLASGQFNIARLSVEQVRAKCDADREAELRKREERKKRGTVGTGVKSNLRAEA